ncbi:MAG: hypothetical protein QW279_01725 [Candidatus Jordarchaeaceae archaeon]
MSKYLLRVEGVNFEYFIYDTDKIQPIRGGSYLLEESIASLVGLNLNGINLEKVMTGASIGLFSFEGQDSQAKQVEVEVRNFLMKKTDGHATFVVNVLENSGDFQRDYQTITAMNRWQQFQQPTLILPEANSGATEQCSFDGIRPGVDSTFVPGKTFSKSVAFRIQEGRKLRQDIYRRILDDSAINSDLTFTDDLEELSKNESKGTLNNKMAVIYFDGNRFTKIKENLCRSEDDLRKFSSIIENSRKEFLKSLLNNAKRDIDFKVRINGKEHIQLETLMWAGDELEIIVPAWKGWEVVKLFFESTKVLNFNGVALTHSGGVVFCNHKAPIQQVRKIVRELARVAKEKLPSNYNSLNHDQHDVFHYLIMESFDTVGPDIKNFVEQYYGRSWYEDFLLNLEQMEKVEKALLLMKSNGFPHNKVFEIIKILKTFPARLKVEVDKVLDRAFSGVNNSSDIKVAVEAIIGSSAMMTSNFDLWLMLADLWDYVGG